MESPKQNSLIMFEDSVKTSNDNRIKLIEETIKYLEKNDIHVSIDHYELYLILDEAISNSMEHGNRWLIEKMVTLKILKPNIYFVEITIKDEGKGFNPMNMPEKTNGIQTLSTRGRGIMIIKKFCEAFWDENGSLIRLRLTIH